MTQAQRRHVESVTTEVFPRIHLGSSHEELGRYQQKIARLLDAYTRAVRVYDLVAQKAVLEVGCGGRASGIYALQPYEPASIHALDLSARNITNTRKLCQAFGFQNVVVQQGNALDLAFKDRSFDFVFSNGVIHHTTNPYQCFREMVRVLRPHGYLFLGIYGYGGVWGRIVHPLGMTMGKIIPLSLSERLVNATGLLKSQENSLLDWFYAPIQAKYPAARIMRWFEESEFDQTLRLQSPRWFYRMGFLTSLLFGDGYIYVMGRKKPD